METTSIDELIKFSQNFLGTTDPSQFLDDSDLPKGSAWCCAFVQYCLEQVEKKLFVKSWIYPTSLVMKMWDNSPKESRELIPVPGRIVVWEKANTPFGHCGVVVRVTSNGNNYQTVEGNSRNPLGQGNGVYPHIHAVNPGIGPLRRLGFLNPFQVA